VLAEASTFANVNHAANQAILWRRRRANARSPPHAAMRPGNPAPTIGAGTCVAPAAPVPLVASVHEVELPGKPISAANQMVAPFVPVPVAGISLSVPTTEGLKVKRNENVWPQFELPPFGVQLRP